MRYDSTATINAGASCLARGTVTTRRIEGFEELIDAVHGARIDVLQLERGRLRGYLTHMMVGGMPLSLGAFSVGVRTRGVLSDDRITIGMLTGRTDRVRHWSHDVHPADVLVVPPGDSHDGRYHGGASYAAISLDQADIASIFGSEPRLREFGLATKTHYRADPHRGEFVLRRLREIVSRLEDPRSVWSADAAAFWKRSIIEIMAASILSNEPADEDDAAMLSARRIVGKVENYLEACGSRPVHISEICCKVHVSRRTLHRAFRDAIGIGPVAFLRCRRLCSVHSVLRSSDPATTTIADVAMDQGFPNPGRFSGYYHQLFDEYPSETLASFDTSTPARNYITSQGTVLWP
jgi:AraC-like DNA-binding protein